MIGNTFLLIYTLSALVILFAYIWITLFYRRGWLATPTFEIPPAFQPRTSVSIIIPARNEATTISRCLNSILAQNYPEQLMEIIVIDDHSEDETPSVVKAINDPRIRLLTLAEHLSPATPIVAFKKKAIELAINHAKGTLIITKDADCWGEANWLRSLAAFYEQEHPVMIAAPVTFHAEKSSLQRFQSLDFTGMMAVTAAGIRHGSMHLANGANLCYEKKAFLAVNGFQGIDQLASGDDLLLMQKMVRQFPGKIGFCKSLAATVRTSPQADWNSFLTQRIRWATKSAQYPDWQITLALAIVFLLCWGILISFLLAPFLGKTVLLTGLVALTGKSLADFYLLYTTTKFFRRQDLLYSFPTSQLWHIAYIAVVGLLANLRKEYEWKGRRSK